MDQPKPNSNPSSINQTNLQNINSPALQFIMNLMRSKLLQGSTNQSGQSSSSSTLQKHSQKISFGSSTDSSTASSPLSPSSTDSSFLLSAKQFQSPQTSSSLSQLNLGSLVNFNLSAVLNAASSSNKRSKSNSQNKSSLNNKSHILNSSSSSEPSTEIESISTTVKTKKKKSAFKFDNRKYIRRSLTPMGELLQPIKVPTLDCNPQTDSSSIKHSHSLVLSKNEFENSLESFDLVKSHQILELYEARIQMGHDDVHLHPALAIKAADEKSGTAFSKEEIKRFDNYDQINVYQPRPNFWPSRVWDKSTSNIQDEQNKIDEKTTINKDLSNRPTELTDQQSDKLQKMIEDSYKIPEIEVTYSSKSSKSQKKKRPRRTLSSSSSVSGIKNLRNQKSFATMASTVINLYAINVITDDSDFDTDFEDF